MFFVIPKMPSKTFVMVLKKLPGHFKRVYPHLFILSCAGSDGELPAAPHGQRGERTTDQQHLRDGAGKGAWNRVLKKGLFLPLRVVERYLFHFNSKIKRYDKAMLKLLSFCVNSINYPLYSAPSVYVGKCTCAYIYGLCSISW